ncbi:putative ataxia telangiectasia mutated [Diaporthe ampelina]|uniref:Putative ataxia telangiectasia mutated n=1 Tax=Diaporthe ampelina TaxID=1214573 RepID=A0A0G2HPP6_9PEZI|nr:putative ataxia telangiectasia mutated [Diaporthe ampelina]
MQLLSEYFSDPSKVGLVPETFMDKFLSLEDDQFLLCREFLVELLQSDFGNVSNYAKDIVEQTAAIVFKDNYKTCEVALCMLIDVLLSFAPVWSMGEGDPDVVNPFVDLYNILVKSVWPHNLMSPEVQLSYSGLLLHLWEINAQFHKDKKSLVSPPHKTLLSTPESLTKTRIEVRDPRPGPFWEGTMRAKFYIAPRLTRIFEFFVVSTHEDIFVDILEALPTDPEVMEGIGLRIFVLAGLGYIIGHFCDVIDQEGPIEDSWRKDETFSYAADFMDQIKMCGQSSTALGPNQQPMFKGKYLHGGCSTLFIQL